MTAPHKKTSKSFIALAIINGLGVLASGFALAVLAPNLMKMFEEFGIDLSTITLLVLRWSQFWPVIIIFFSFASLGSLIIHWLLRKKKRGLATAWFFLVSTAWVLWFLLLILSFGLPWITIQEGLAG